VVGFAARATGHSNRYYSSTNAGPLVAFIIQACLILLAPLFFAASVYMFLSRIIRATGHSKYSPIQTKWLTKIFVGGDLLCLNIQSSGASLLTNSKGNALKSSIGTNMIIGGLALQMVVFGFFLAVAWIFHKCMRNGPVAAGEQIGGGWDWAGYLRMLYLVSGIITFRNLYRVIEYIMGEDGYLMTTEWSIYVLDALPMAVVLVICTKWYVGDMSKLLGEEQGDMEMMVGVERGNSQSGETARRF
jgi:hypothetical protein